MKLNKSLLGKVITALTFLIFTAYFIINHSKFKFLLHLNPLWLLIIALGDLAVIGSNGLFIKFILQPFNKVISVVESIYVSMISSVGNFFAPVGGGFGFRAVYLKKRHGLSYADYMSTLSGNYVIVFLVNSFFALLSLYLLRSHFGGPYLTLLLLFSGIFVFSALLSIVRLPLSIDAKVSNMSKSPLKRITSLLVSITRGWHKISRDKSLMSRLIGLTAFNFLVSLLIARVEITALGFHIGISQLLLFSVLGSLSLFVNVTPANLGVKEAIYIFSRTVIGFSTSQVLAIALVDRGILFTILFISWLLSRRRSKGATTLQ